MIIKRQAKTMQKRQPFWCTQCPNSLTRFHSLLQVGYIRVMYGIVNDCGRFWT